jgi:hypothetical protein
MNRMCVMIIVVQQNRFTTKNKLTIVWKGMHKEEGCYFKILNSIGYKLSNFLHQTPIHCLLYT